MQDHPRTAICAVAIHHDRCGGTVFHLDFNEPCECPCHDRGDQ